MMAKTTNIVVQIEDDILKQLLDKIGDLQLQILTLTSRIDAMQVVAN